MPRPTKLLPGEEVTVAAFNAEIDRARKQLSWAQGSTIQSGTTGGSLTPMREIKPVWGRLTGTGPKSSPNYYQWEEVYPDNEGNWTAKTGDADTQLAPNDSLILSDVYGTDWIINPAVPVNDIKAPIGKIVRLIPTENFVEEGKGLRDNADDYWMHRHWLFSGEEQLRPFKLTGPMINAGGAGIGTSAEKDLTAAAEFLDNPGEEVTLYPAHRAGFPAGDEFFALGIGRGPGNYFRGTYGWAQLQTQATITEFDSNGDPVWQSEWQIVTLYADLIQQVRVYDAAIEPGERGKAQLWWIDKHVNHTGDFAIDPVIENSNWQIELFNDLDVVLVVGTKLKAYFSRPHYVWVPLSVPFQTLYAEVQTGFTNAAGDVSHTVSVKSCDYLGNDVTGDAFDVQTQIRDNMDTALFVDYIVQYHVLSDGTKVIENDIWDRPIGQVIWESVDVANIRDGWRLCDGSGGAPDLRGRFIMHIDDSGLGEADEDDIGDTGGFRDHGPTENNHDKHTKLEVVDTIGDHDDHSQHSGAEVAAALDDHDPHTHTVSSSDPNVAPAGATPVVESPTESAANATGMSHSGGGGGTTPLSHSAHTAHVVEAGDHDLDHSETDNRPRYYVFAALQRFE